MSAARQWPAAIDGLLDGALVTFAAWTLWYEVALATQFDMRWSGWLFLVGGVVVMGSFAFHEVREAQSSVSAVAQGRAREIGPPATPPVGAPPVRRAVTLFDFIWVLGLACLALSVAFRESLGVLPASAIGIALVVVAAWRRLAEPISVGEPVAGPALGQVEHAIAGAVSVGLGLLSLFLFRSDADDVFYVNRAAWVAGHGTAALRDTMFGPDTLGRASGTGLPTPSVEALQGVAAHLLGIEAATFAYLVYTPLLASVVGWVSWRLVRAWAPRRHVLVLVAAMLFVLASGHAIVGNYSIGRIWQGKVTAYAVLLPLVWLYLTHVGRRVERRRIVLMAAAGVAFVGLTTSSALMSPVVLGGALLAALLSRSKGLLVGGLAFAVAPIVNGVVQIIAPADVGDGTTAAASARQVFAIAYGSSTAMVTLGLVGTVVAVLIVRRSDVPVLAAAAIVSLAAYLPGVIAVANAATGAGPVVWRLAIAAPLWVFVGLLVAVPTPSLHWVSGRWSTAGRVTLVATVTAVVLVVPIAAGTWLWSADVGGRLTAPRWKVDPVALADVRAAQKLDLGRGLWLMPKPQMQNLAISKAGPFAVVPRDFYLASLEEPAVELRNRRVLLALVSRQPVPAPRVENVRGALKRLDVSLACVPGDARGARSLLSTAVGEDLRKVGSMRCYIPAS